MTFRLPTAAIALLLAMPALAQEPPAAAPVASGRCTGVFCDLYYANKPAPAPGQPDTPDPTHLPCHDFLCAAFGGRTPDPAPPTVAQATPEPAADPTKLAKHKRKARKTAAVADSAKADLAK